MSIFDHIVQRSPFLGNLQNTFGAQQPQQPLTYDMPQMNNQQGQQPQGQPQNAHAGQMSDGMSSSIMKLITSMLSAGGV